MANEMLNVSGSHTSNDSYAVYNTQETVIGRWIDGKPIYRIMLTENLPKIGAVDALVTVARKSDYNIDQIINIDYAVKRTDNYEHIATLDSFLGFGWINDTIYTYTPHSAYPNATMKWLKLEYTKTTD